ASSPRLCARKRPPFRLGLTPLLGLESRKRLAFRDVTGKSIWKERLPWTTTSFYEPRSKRCTGFPSETRVKRGFPRRACGQGAFREARQECPLPMRLRPQVSRGAACGPGATKAPPVTITIARRFRGTACAVPFMRSSLTTIPSDASPLLVPLCRLHGG